MSGMVIKCVTLAARAAGAARRVALPYAGPPLRTLVGPLRPFRPILLPMVVCTAVAGPLPPIPVDPGAPKPQEVVRTFIERTFTPRIAPREPTTRITGTVPEPASLAILGIGIVGLKLARRIGRNNRRR